MYERLVLTKELLTSNGNIFLHCDDTKNFLLRGILEEVFSGHFVNEIIWKRSTSTGLAQKRCGTLHDTIYWYSKNDGYKFNMQYHEYEDKYLDRAREDENGRLYIPIPTGNPGPRPNLYYEYKGAIFKWHWYDWVVEFGCGLAMIIAFCWDWKNILRIPGDASRQGIPNAFAWWIYLPAYIAAVTYYFCRLKQIISHNISEE